MKKEYLELKLNELKVYEKQLKDNYYKAIKVYKNKKEVLYLQYIGRIDKCKFEKISNKIITDEVVLTEKQREHILKFQ